MQCSCSKIFWKFPKKLARAGVQRRSLKKMFLEVSQNPQKNTCAKVFFFNKFAGLAPVFFCEFCEISKNIFFHRTPMVAASAVRIERFYGFLNC